MAVALPVYLTTRTDESTRVVVPLRGSPTSRRTFVGSTHCATCHKRENDRWSGSHHQLAMQPASNSTVLGNFNDAKFSDDRITSTFFRKNSKFMVRTDGPDGALHDYEISYTFGVYPLQQYLIEMPGGRLQALGIAWDCRPRDRGGQRWFFLYPGQNIPPADRLHWTGIDQNWNYMCADCHSTNLRKNYDLRTRTYATTYNEINVACEACHGPGSEHLAWANKQGGWKRHDSDRGLTITLDERQGAAWTIDSATGNPKRTGPPGSEREIQMCARCHSRRGQIHEDYVHGQSVDDDYRVALLDDDLYFSDGQIKGEVYEYGSFTQSRMFHAGVTCSDCHEPHSLKLRAEGNNVCLQCHSAQRYDTPKHHFHRVSSSGAQCVECHMPTRVYMVVDARRDHSLRIPRPDLSVKLGTPNACTNCHIDKSARWASESIDKWYGGAVNGFQRYAEALNAGLVGAPGAEQALAELISTRAQPAIARATALSMVATYSPAPAEVAIRTGATDNSPLVRRAAAGALSNFDARTNLNMLASLLHDPIRAVRLELAGALTITSLDDLPLNVRTDLTNLINEYIVSEELNADRPEAHLNLGLLDEKEGNFDKSEGEFKTALSLDPTFAPAAIDLADLYREQNRDREGERVLDYAIGRSPNEASLRYALGLLMVRQKRNSQGLDFLAAAARLDPENPRYSYVYAVALNDSGQTSGAIETLKRNILMHPYDRDSLAALVSICKQVGRSAEALTYTRRLDQLQ